MGSDTDTDTELNAVGSAMASIVLDRAAREASIASTASPPPLDTANSPSARVPTKVVAAFETAEGVGARVRRSIGTPALWNPSPFLILDYCRLRPGQGFPDHPHRGMSTVTYVLEGSMQHEDFLGNRGVLSAGDVQWMTAGRGILHSEMPLFDPEDDDPPDVVALQLWIDLPAARKMSKPTYKEKKSAGLARAEFPHGSAVVVAGASHGVTGPIRGLGSWFIDLRFEAGANTVQPLPRGWTAFAYVLEGKVFIGGKEVRAHNCVLLSDGDDVQFQQPKGTSRVVLVAGEPLDQPVVLQGPFVGTSRDAAVTALRDFQNGKNGFERAPGWQSEIGKDVGMAARRTRAKGKAKGRREERRDDWNSRASDSDPSRTVTTGGNNGSQRGGKSSKSRR